MNMTIKRFGSTVELVTHVEDGPVAIQPQEEREARLQQMILNKAVSPDSEDTECARCRQEEHIPKVYSSSINMDPGPVRSEASDSELLVC